jgi:hypothetical protein
MLLISSQATSMEYTHSGAHVTIAENAAPRDAVQSWT